MEMTIENIRNLMSLWWTYGNSYGGASAYGGYHYHKHWPYRCWSELSSTAPINPQLDSYQFLDSLPQDAIVPVYKHPEKPSMTDSLFVDNANLERQLLLRGWSCRFMQTAMHLPLTSKPISHSIQKSDISIDVLSNKSELSAWTRVCSDAFGYAIDDVVIAHLLNDDNTTILLASRDQDAVAAGLLHMTGDVVGVHQIGVSPYHRGQGIAKSLMLHIIDIAIQQKAQHIVLQASDSGKPLYQGLGFTSQFAIANYQLK